MINYSNGCYKYICCDKNKWNESSRTMAFMCADSAWNYLGLEIYKARSYIGIDLSPLKHQDTSEELFSHIHQLEMLYLNIIYGEMATRS
jgi:hypothetical protein